MGNSEFPQLIERLLATNLVGQQTGEELAFRHSLMQQAAYGSLLNRDRKRVHNIIANSIERLYASTLDGQTEALAHHYYQGENWEKALEYAARAGTKAQALYAPIEAIQQFTYAIHATQRLGLTPSPSLHRARGRAYENIGNFDMARADLEVAILAAAQTGDGLAEWESMMDMAFLWSSKDYGQMGEYLQRALDLARRLGEPSVLAHSLNRLGNWLANTGANADSLQAHGEALAIFRGMGDKAGEAETHDLLGMAFGLRGDLLQADEHYEEAILLFRGLGDMRGLQSSLVERRGLSCLELNQVALGAAGTPCTTADLERDMTEAIQIAQQIHWPAGEAVAHIQLGMAVSAFGDFRRAFTHLTNGLEIAEGIMHRQWVTGAQLGFGNLYLQLLEPTLAIHTLEIGLAIARELGSAWWIGLMSSHLALAHLMQHEPEKAETRLRDRMPPDAQPRNLHERHILYAWGLLALAQGKATQALEIANRLADPPTAAQSSRTVPPALLKLKAEALAALGDVHGASETLEAARQGATERWALPQLWQIRTLLGQIYRRLGRQVEAASELQAAREIVESLATTVDESSLREGFRQAALQAISGG